MVVSELLTQSIYISLFLNKPLQYIGIENYKTINPSKIVLEREDNFHNLK
jgi:hypothetical protein